MDLQRAYSFQTNARLVFGAGVVHTLGAELRALGGARALVVTDPGVAKSGALADVLSALEGADVAFSVFSEVEPNPTTPCVERCLGHYLESGCDCLVAVGGGSSIDVAKATGVLVNNPGPLSRYEGRDRFANPLPLFVAVPTTCGTGAEVTFNAVITDPERRFKFTVSSPLTVPRVAFLDPTLLKTLPGPAVAATGMDALTHAVESYANTGSHPLADALNLHAIRLVGEHLPAAVARGDVTSLAHMLLASSATGLAFTNTGVTIVHAMSHPLSARAGLPHGVANAVLLPYVMEWNLIGAAQRYADIAAALGERVEGLGRQAAAERSVVAVRELSRRVGIPATLGQLGVDPTLFPAMAEDALQLERCFTNNPRRTSLADVVAIYQRALG